MKPLRLILHWANIHWQLFSEYRLGAFAWIINGLVGPLLMMTIWLVVAQHSSLAYNRSQIITYYILTIFVSRLTQAWSTSHVGRSIRDGRFSRTIIQPYHYLVEELGTTLGLKAIRFFTLIPIAVILYCLFHHDFSITFSTSKLCLFILALLLGFAINFYYRNTLAMLVFWLEEYYSLDALSSLASQAFSGNLIPLALAPPLFVSVMKYTPFRFFVSFPIEVVINQTITLQAFQGFSVGIIYLVVFLCVHQVLYHHGLKHYGAYGN